MDVFTRAALEAEGFRGFVPLHALDVVAAAVPAMPGVYIVIRESAKPATFLKESPGGRFKFQDPTDSIEKLTNKWVDGCCVLYIGKAGGKAAKRNLQARLIEYRDFGRGKPVGHWGGRYVWQLADARELLVCWKPTPTDPRVEEKALLAKFKERYGRLPFANHRG